MYSRQALDSEPEAWWGGSQASGEDDYDPEDEDGVFSHDHMVEVFVDHAAESGRHAILVSPATDPLVPIARQQVAVRCSQATTVGVGPQNSLDNGMEAEIPFVEQPQRAGNLGLPAMEEERVEDVDILPRPSRRLVLLGAGSVPGSDSPLAVDEDEPMDVADHQDAVVVHDEGSEVSVDEEPEPPTAPDPEVVTTRGLTPAIRAALMELDGVDLAHEFSRSCHEDGSSFLEESFP